MRFTSLAVLATAIVATTKRSREVDETPIGKKPRWGEFEAIPEETGELFNEVMKEFESVSALVQAAIRNGFENLVSLPVPNQSMDDAQLLEVLAELQGGRETMEQAIIELRDLSVRMDRMDDIRALRDQLIETFLEARGQGHVIPWQVPTVLSTFMTEDEFEEYAESVSKKIAEIRQLIEQEYTNPEELPQVSHEELVGLMEVLEDLIEYVELRHGQLPFPEPKLVEITPYLTEAQRGRLWVEISKAIAEVSNAI